jgi:hypothetical protein
MPKMGLGQRLPRGRVTVCTRSVTKSGMGGDVRDVLKGLLGEDARAVDLLSDEELEQLHGALETARRNQARALAAATEEAMAQLPPLLRGSVRRFLVR